MDLEISAEILRSKNISLGFSFLSPSSLAHLDRRATFLNSSSVTVFDLLEMYGLQLKKGRGKKKCWFSFLVEYTELWRHYKWFENNQISRTCTVCFINVLSGENPACNFKRCAITLSLVHFITHRQLSQGCGSVTHACTTRLFTHSSSLHSLVSPNFPAFFSRWSFVCSLDYKHY